MMLEMSSTIMQPCPCRTIYEPQNHTARAQLIADLRDPTPNDESSSLARRSGTDGILGSSEFLLPPPEQLSHPPSALTSLRSSAP